MPYIHFDHVNKYFGQNHVLKDISLEIEQGELVTFWVPLAAASPRCSVACRDWKL